MKAAEIYDVTGIDIINHPTLLSELSNNPKIFVYPNFTFLYQARFKIDNKEELLAQIQLHTYGIDCQEFAEYKNLDKEVGELVAEGKIFFIRNGGNPRLYPNQHAFYNLKVMEHFANIWKGIKTPAWREEDLKEIECNKRQRI